MRPKPSVLIIGVSMPRAGHHFAARLLQGLYCGDLFYCERYVETDCCQRVPCARRGLRPVSYQKSHDFDVNLPTDVCNAIYLIQHRAPVPLLLSAREHYVQVQYDGPYGDAIGSDRGEYAVWLGRQAEYYAAFSRRWLLSPPPNSLVLDYKDLAADPAAFLARIVERVGIEVPPGRIDDSIAGTIERAGRFGEDPYVRRSLDERPFLDRELLATCESLLFAQEIGLTSGRVFDPSPFKGTLIWQVFEARRRWRMGDLDGALEQVDRAIASSPRTGLLFHERALLLQRQGAVADAHDALAQAFALSPQHPQILAAQVDVALTLGDVAAARASAEAFVALNPNEPTDRVVLALARSHRPDHLDDERCVATVRLLEDELIAREIALRQGQQRQAKAEATLQELAKAADERLRDVELAHAEARRVHDAYARLSDQIEEKEQAIADLRSTVDEKERLIAELAAAAEERLRLVDEQESAIEEKERLIVEQARAIEEKERLIVELATAAEERLQLVQRLDAEARRSREAARLTDEPPEGDHDLVIRASSS